MPTRQQYPFEGCCEHTSNAHTRDHCLLCTCAKPAVQITVNQGSKVEEPEPEAGLTELHECGVCHHLVTKEGREAALDWHERLSDTIANLGTAIGGLRQRHEHEAARHRPLGGDT